MLSGSRASDTPGQAPLRPQRRPPRPRHPIVGVCYRAGLRLGRRRPEARPHRHQTGGVALHEDPCMSCLPMTSPPNGGNCTIRGATRRRHADRTLLMLQNPHHYPRRHAPSLVQDYPPGRHTAPRRDLTDSKLWGLALHGDPCVTCLPVTSPPNGGNCTIRGATRRRHADRTLLMLQNPHHYPRRHAPSLVQDYPPGRHTAPRRDLTDSKLWGLALHGDPCVTCLPMTSPPNGGNCTIRGATRRRHAEERLLMLQNPHLYPWCHAPSLAS